MYIYHPGPAFMGNMGVSALLAMVLAMVWRESGQNHSGQPKCCISIVQAAALTKQERTFQPYFFIDYAVG